LDKTKPLAFVLPAFPTGAETALEVVAAGAGLATIGIAGGNTGCPKLGSAAGRTAGGTENVDVVAGTLLLVEGRDEVLAHAEEDADEELAPVGEGGCEGKGEMTSPSGERKLLKRGD
jgi:hypothetical protein